MQICSCILEERSLSDDKFATDMLPSLLALAKDAIPNVRITLAIAMARHLIHSGNEAMFSQFSCMSISVLCNVWSI